MKIVLLTSNSIQNKYLANRIEELHKIELTIIEERFDINSRLKNLLKSLKYNPFKIAIKIIGKILLFDVDKKIQQVFNENFSSYKYWPKNVKLTSNINDAENVKILIAINPDLILVSGTRLIKNDILQLNPRFGILNMHTGLSPYYNGGPSCTFWCLYNNEPELIGSTVMFISSGIDTGNIIRSKTVEIESSDNHAKLEYKAVYLGVNLYCEVINSILNSKTQNSVPQDNIICNKKIYYNRDFTITNRVKVKIKLMFNKPIDLINKKQNKINPILIS